MTLESLEHSHSSTASGFPFSPSVGWTSSSFLDSFPCYLCVALTVLVVMSLVPKFCLMDCKYLCPAFFCYFLLYCFLSLPVLCRVHHILSFSPFCRISLIFGSVPLTSASCFLPQSVLIVENAPCPVFVHVCPVFLLTVWNALPQSLLHPAHSKHPHSSGESCPFWCSSDIFLFSVYYHILECPAILSVISNKSLVSVSSSFLLVYVL